MSVIDMAPQALLDLLRSEGSDNARVEAKRAGDGYPGTLAPTLSALANMPGGGVIILGLDEKRGFSVIGVPDAADYQRRLANQARNAVTPPVQVTVETAQLEGASVVIARVAELAPVHKPCTVRSSGRAYLRSYDGDYAISEQERELFVANRGPQRWDRGSVEGASAEVLDPTLTASYLANGRARSIRLSTMSDAELLEQTRVVGTNGDVSLAGLYALGSYPQRFHPTLSVTARVAPRPGDPPGTRSTDIAHFDGPLPELLDQTVYWVRRNTATRVRFGPDGHGRDEPEYPTDAIRELVANALVHRDIGTYALSDRVSVVLEHHRLIITNPGGLWGVTVDQLGARLAGSARNQSLYDICKDVRTADNRRVIEGVGSGIRTVLDSLSRAGMTPPQFIDDGIRFTVVVPNHALLDPKELTWVATLPGAEGLSDVGRHVVVAMRQQTVWTNRTLRDMFPMDSTQARNLLVELVDRGLAEAVGERGSRSYRLHPQINSSLDGRTGAPASLNTDQASTPLNRRGEAKALTHNQLTVVELLTSSDLPLAELAARSGLSIRQVDYALRSLREDQRVELVGRRGQRHSVYRLVR